MLKNGWMLFLILALTIPTAACVTGRSSYVVAPSLFQYAPEVEQRAANELRELGPPCPRTEFVAGCSAVQTMINDYKTVRDQIRKGKK